MALLGSKCEAFLGHLYLVELTIQFTLEQELDGKLPFWDILLDHRQDGCISTLVYKKETHMDKYFSFDSHHPLAHTLAVVHMLQHRANVLSSTREALKEEEAHLTNTLLENGYPRWMVHRFSNSPGKATERVEEQPKATISLLYVYGISEALKRVLKPFRVRTVMKPNQILM